MSATLQLDEKALRSVVEEVLRGLGKAGASAPASQPAPSVTVPSVGAAKAGRRFGVFDNPNDACNAAQDAFEQLKEKGIAGRAKVVEIVKAMCAAKAQEWGKF